MTNAPIKALPLSDRPRERLLAHGTRSLRDEELVSLVFGGDLPCAEALLGRFGSARGLAQALPGELGEVPRLGPARTAQLRAALELGRRATEPPPDPGEPLHTPYDARRRFDALAALDEEELHALALDGRNRVRARFLSARGAANVVHVSPRDLFRRLLREGATAVILAHNHPSGDPTPSPEDRALTARIREAGACLGVPMLDHLIVASGAFYSFTEGRLLHGRGPIAEAPSSAPPATAAPGNEAAPSAFQKWPP